MKSTAACPPRSRPTPSPPHPLKERRSLARRVSLARPREPPCLPVLLAERLDGAKPASVSCTTPRVELSSLFCPRQPRRNRRRYVRRSGRARGDRQRTTASCRSIRAMTQTMPTSATPAVTKGMTLSAMSTAWPRVVLDTVFELAVPLASW